MQHIEPRKQAWEATRIPNESKPPGAYHGGGKGAGESLRKSFGTQSFAVAKGKLRDWLLSRWIVHQPPGRNRRGQAGALSGVADFVKLSLQPRRRWAGLLLAAGFLIAAHVSAQNCDPAPTGLIGWWPGDGGANDIASTNNGTLQGGATATTPGVVGTAFLFDGTNSYISIPDSPVLHPTNLTIEAWVRCDLLDTPSAPGISYPGQQYIIFHQNAQTGNFEGFDLAKDREPRFTGTNDTWCFELTSVEGDNVYVESLTSVQTNVWYHIAGVRGSNYIQLYVNGQLEAETSVDFPIGYGNFPLYFATTGQSYWDHKFGGALDEVGLYNRALSASEIAAIYAAGRQGKCKTPTLVSIGLSPGASQPPAHSPALTIAGLGGQAYGIQASSSPLGPTNQWVGLTNLMLPGSTDVWLDPAGATNAQRFYRVLPGTIPVP